MRTLATLLACVLSVSALSAQTNATDVGIQIIGSSATSSYGQMCGAVTCTPIPAGTVTPASSRIVTTYGGPGSPYILAIGLPGPCFPFPGIANVLLLSSPVTLTVGTTLLLATTTCTVGPARYTLAVPAGAPTGFTFRLQSLCMSYALGIPAFTPALEVHI
jgi:hypothetical protein